MYVRTVFPFIVLLLIFSLGLRTWRGWQWFQLLTRQVQQWWYRDRESITQDHSTLLTSIEQWSSGRPGWDGERYSYNNYLSNAECTWLYAHVCAVRVHVNVYMCMKGECMYVCHSMSILCFVCICICVLECVCVCVWSCVYACMCVCGIQTFTYVHVHVATQLSTPQCMHECRYIYGKNDMA